MQVDVLDFVPYAGQHCETNATGALLERVGISLSEPMLFGLGEGLGFGVFTFKAAPAPFFGGRSRFEEITKTLGKNLNLKVDFRSTRSKKKAWHNVASFVDAGVPVAAKLDCFYLDYFTTKVHFAAHYLVVFGYTEDRILVADTSQQGARLSTDRRRFEEGRFYKGPMASNALTWTIQVPSEGLPPTPEAIRVAVRSNAQTFLNPPIKNLGYKGISKAAGLVERWFEQVREPVATLHHLALMMERAGTGGALFRNFYRDFLSEAQQHLSEPRLASAQALFADSAGEWTRVSQLLELAAEQEESRHLKDAADRMRRCAKLEYRAMEELVAL